MSQCRSAGIHPQERGGDHRRLLRHKYNPLCRQIDQHILEFLISASISSSPAPAGSSSTLSPRSTSSISVAGDYIYMVENLRLPFIYPFHVCFRSLLFMHTGHNFSPTAESPVAMSCVLHSSLDNAPPAAACCQTSHFHDKISDRVLLINTFHRSLATNNSAAAVAPSLAHDGDVYGKLQFSAASQSP